jgi:hypothetical protein
MKYEGLQVMVKISNPLHQILEETSVTAASAIIFFALFFCMFTGTMICG